MSLNFQIIISPAKKMNEETDILAPEGMPVFMESTAEIMRWMQELSYEEAKKLWGNLNHCEY